MEIPASNIDFSLNGADWRLDFQGCLDSISNLAVSAPQHEFYAVALQGAPHSLQLVFAAKCRCS